MFNAVELNFSEAAENMRLRAIRETGLVDTPNRPSFDRLTNLLRKTFKSEIALLSFMEGTRQFYLSRQGMVASETPRAISFCNHVVANNAPMLIQDARVDARFRHTPLVTQAGGIRSYLGVPLTLRSGITVGSLCVADSRAHRFSAEQVETLTLNAGIASDLIAAQIAENIAAVKAAEMEIKSNRLLTVNSLLQSAESVAEIGSWSVSADLQDLIWSKQTFLLHELDLDTRISVREAINFYAPEDRDMVSDSIATALRDKAGYEFDATILTAKGNRKKVKVIGDYIKGTRWVDDRLIGVIQQA
jgi:hypothetical protein